jgi:hypothetical protein
LLQVPVPAPAVDLAAVALVEFRPGGLVGGQTAQSSEQRRAGGKG